MGEFRQARSVPYFLQTNMSKLKKLELETSAWNFYLKPRFPIIQRRFKNRTILHPLRRST